MILIITAVFPPEPIVSANLSKDIACKLSDMGLDVTVISPKPSRPYGRQYDDKITEYSNYNHFTLKSYTNPKSNFFGRFLESISFGLASRKFIRENQAEIKKIYANTWPLFAQYFIVKEAKRFNIPIIMHIQDVYPESYIKKIPKFAGVIISNSIMPIERYVMKHSSQLITISEDMKKYLAHTRRLNKNNIFVVRNWQDNELLSKKIPADNTPDKKFTFMFAGSISPSAGVDLLIKSFGDLGTKSNCRLVIAGHGSDREYCIKLAKGNTNIEFWDAPFIKIPEIQNKADVLLLSLRKGVGKTATPSKFTAYLFARKPVLASIDEDCGTASDIKIANCGFVVPPENENDLRLMMERILDMDQEALKQLGANGFTFAQQHLSRKINLEKIARILTS